jgi:CRISPR system Cascade subunit CasE
LLLLSRDKPDFFTFSGQFGIAGQAWETRDYTSLLERLNEGQTWRFKLTANPTHSGSNYGDKRGKIYAHMTIERQEEWFTNQAEKYGFSAQFAVTERDLKIFYRNNNRVTLNTVTFEGILRIDNVQLLRSAMIDGIGRGKAYGCGLLTLASL